ncbi:MAG TPA: sigma-70 family RNA polymerase sigma factor [Thermosynergistes sp.]|nr:sigma-70 family RNA polymerase sigma factor [Thermosynergistes sp.]HPZ76232.1 sigma-70 family RNA polymerase sigma factor [Thermosynergistes sp.]
MARNSSSQGLDPQEETELWRLCRQGDEEAREALIVAYRPLVFWLARRFSLDEGTAKDLLQEGMLALIKAVDAYDVSRGNKFTTYAFYRIRGHMINFLERSEKRAPYPVDMEEEIAQPGECVAVEWRLLLEEAMGALTLKERDIVQALVVEGKKAGDVARDTAIDVSHVYRIRRKALARLRIALGLPAPLGERKRG